MNVIKHELNGYVTEDRCYRVTYGYPAFNSAKYWMVDEKGNKNTKCFKTLKEAKQYISEQYTGAI